jgi:tetratricopeptide (TPR) repeat protein
MTAERVHFDRGLALYQQGRWDLAERSLREHLAGDPDDGDAHSLMALALLNQDRVNEARSEAEAALAAVPDEPVAHIAMGGVLSRQGRLDQAAEHAQEAIQLAPSSVEGRRLLASIRFNQRRWADALDLTTEALAIDPDDGGLQALRANTLTQMGRRDAATEAIEGTLRRDPENPSAHTAQGFAFLHQARPKQAMESFREALRLDPTSESARIGLIEAMKGRNPIYAVVLRWFLWMSRLGPRALIGVLIGWLALSRISRLLAGNPATAALGTAMLVVLVGFAWLTFAAEPLFNVVLLLDPFGRHALNQEEREEGTIVAASVAVGLLAAIAFVVTQGELAALLAVTAFGVVIPIHVAYAAHGRFRQGIPVVLAFTMLAICLVGGLFLAIGDQRGQGLVFIVFALAVVSSWLSWPVMSGSRR